MTEPRVQSALRRSLGVRTGRRRLAALVGSVLWLQTGCVEYRPVLSPSAQAIEVDQSVALQLTDAGRAELAGKLGPGVLNVEGKVARRSEQSWTLRTYRVETITGEAWTWTGELVEIPQSSVAMVRTKHFDTRRTAVAVAATVGAAAVFILSRGIIGGGSDPEGPPRVPPPATEVRYQ